MVEHDEKIWKKFLSKHWKMVALFITIAVLFIAGAFFVFIWFVEEAQVTGLVPETLNLWTLGYIVTFLLHLIFWEIIFIGIPLLVVIAAFYVLGWKRIPAEERQEYKEGHLFGKRSHRADGGGAISFVINIFFIIKVYLDGNWNVAFASWTFDYLVYSYLWALLWILIIIGIPVTLGGIWWLHHKLTKGS